MLILNFLNLYFYFYFSFKKGLLLLFQSFDLKNQEGKDYIFQEQMVDIFLQQAIQSSHEAVVWAHGSSISLLMDLWDLGKFFRYPFWLPIEPARGCERT